MKAVSYDVFLCAWYRALNGATPSKLTTRADPDDDRFGRGGCRHRAVRFSGWAADAVAALLTHDSSRRHPSVAMSAEVPQKDATMAIHTTIGFGLSALGAWGSGIVVDLGGGPARTSASGRT